MPEHLTSGRRWRRWRGHERGLLWVACVALVLVLPAPEPHPRYASAVPTTSGSIDAAAPTGNVLQQVQALREMLMVQGPAPVQPLAAAVLCTAEAAHGTFSLEVAAVLDLLVECAWRSGAATAPLTMAQAERAMRIHLVLADNARVAESLRNMGLLYEFCNRLPEARDLYVQARDILARVLGPASPRVAMLGNDIAIVATRMGRFEEAIASYNGALTLLESAAGVDSLEIACVLNGLACALHEHGDFAAARDAHERALELRTRHLPAEHAKVAETLNNLGALLASMGDAAGARELFERVLAVRRRVYGDRYPLTAAAMVNVARMRLQQHELAAAEQLYTEALRLLEPEGSDASLVSCLVGLGILHQETGEIAAAAADFARGLDLAGVLLGPEHPYVGELLHRLATVRYEAGELDRARDLCTRAISQRQQSLGKEHPEVARSLVLMATILAEQGENPTAWNVSTEAEAIGRGHQEFASRALAEREALLVAGIRARGLDLMQELVLRTPAAAAELAPHVWDAVIRARAVVLDEMVRRRRAAALSQDPQLTRLVADLRAASTRFANLALQNVSAGGAAYEERVLAAARARDAAERALAARSLEFREWRTRRELGLDAVARALPSGDALVAYSVYQRQERHGSRPHAVRELAAFVLAGGEPPRLVALGAMQHVDSLVARWGFEVAAGVGVQGRTPLQCETAYRHAGAALRRVIWDPLQPFLAGAAHVHVVPEGALHLVNIAALPWGNPEAVADGYLADTGVRVHVLASERDLVPVRWTRPGRGLLAMGGADFDGGTGAAAQVSAHVRADEGGLESLALRGPSAPCPDRAGLRFEPLPGTAREVRDVAALWGAAATVLTGQAASAMAFKKEAPGRLVLHLATHGFVLGDECAALPERTRGIQLRRLPLQTAAADLLLQAGLAWAGANRHGEAPADTEDGILTAAEIATLDLHGVEWAVLSACNTGLGTVLLGEGVLGLRRAFQVAGVHTVIMSLWPVADEPTRAWMHALYEARRRRHLSTIDAVHDANTGMLAARRARGASTHPFYWAAFIAAGDWR